MSTFSLQPDATTGIDTYLSQFAPSTSFGSNANLLVGTSLVALNTYEFMRSLLKFDLSPLYDLAFSINSAQLILNVIPAGNGLVGTRSFFIYKTLTAWTEASTWNSFNGGGQAGIDYDVTIGDTTTADGSSPSLNFTSMLASVNDALTNLRGLLNLISIGPEVAGLQRVLTFFSSNNTNGLQPLLEVDYVPLIQGDVTSKDSAKWSCTPADVRKYSVTAKDMVA